MTTDQYDRFSYQDNLSHKDVIKWKHFSRYWSFVPGIQQSLVNSLNIETPSRSLWRHCNAVARECCERCIRGIPCAPSSAGCTDLKPPEEYFALFPQPAWVARQLDEYFDRFCLQWRSLLDREGQSINIHNVTFYNVTEILKPHVATALPQPPSGTMELFHQTVTFTGYRMWYYISYTPKDNSHLLYQHSLSMIRAWISNVIVDFHLGCNYSSTPLS